VRAWSEGGEEMREARREGTIIKAIIIIIIREGEKRERHKEK